MPAPFSTAGREKLRARQISDAWFFDLYTDEGTLRGWNQQFAITLSGDEYEPLGDKIDIDVEINSGSDLVAEPLTIKFDGAAKLDNTSFVGRLLDRTWHQRRIRVRQFVFDVTSNKRSEATEVFSWYGNMDTLSDPEGGSGPAEIILNCESGTFRALARNNQTVTDVNQRLRDANDASFKNMSVKPFQRVPFGIGDHKIAGL